MHSKATCSFVERGEGALSVLLVVVSGTAILVDAASLKREVNASGELGGNGSDGLLCSDAGAKGAAKGSELTVCLE